jgi:hypothetical protein
VERIDPAKDKRRDQRLNPLPKLGFEQYTLITQRGFRAGARTLKDIWF